MQSFVVFAAVLAVAAAGYTPLTYSNVGYSTLGYAAPVVASAPVSSQYHAQDELGQYSYGYAGGPSAKSEVRTADGITRGGYSYIDANGIVQQVQYVSDPVNGFRVAATNLPVGPAAAAAAPSVVAAPLAGPVHIAALPVPVSDTYEVAAAKIQHAQAHAEALARSG
ncbi:unnamed protein product [Allacma fusca]|uniref:Cuticle protein 6 n=1 Tax=Allacma fusca TaxID=39272 RepID=A0A8J2PUI0_9HEXA|nr:unnamed protein product [Allacma fusca]